MCLRDAGEMPVQLQVHCPPHDGVSEFKLSFITKSLGCVGQYKAECDSGMLFFPEKWVRSDF